MSKRLQKNKEHDASHIIYMPEYFQADFEKKSASDYTFYMNIGLLPTDTFDLLPYIAGIKPGHVKDLKERLTYRCPYTGNHYYGAFPVAYLASAEPELAQPRSEMEQFVYSNATNFYGGEDTYGINHIGEIGRSMLGHGYKVETISQDLMNLGLCDIETCPNKEEKIIFKTWKRLDSRT